MGSNSLDKIKESRFEGLTDTIDHYQWMVHDGHKLSDQQREQLQEAVDAISCFGEKAQKWADLGKEILKTT